MKKQIFKNKTQEIHHIHPRGGLKYSGSTLSKMSLGEVKKREVIILNPKESMNSVQITDFCAISDKMKDSLKEIIPSEFLTWIQENSISQIMSRRHVLIKSPSGTGKTLSYAIPLIDSLANNKSKITRQDGVFVLIIVPTKELAKQTLLVFSRVLKYFPGLHASAVYGADKKKSEKSRIRKGVNILIATPGRILDHIFNTTSLSFHNLETIVVDEADLLLELGYERIFGDIMNAIRSKYITQISNFSFDQLQMVLLSATLDSRVKSICGKCLIEPVFVDATPSKKLSLAFQMLSCNSQLFQTVIVVPTKWRFVSLIFLLFKIRLNKSPFKIIIFVGSIYAVKFYAFILDQVFKIYSDRFNKFGFKVFELHGSIGIKERIDIFTQFGKSEGGLLVSTDVAARGLDFENVGWVIQFDPARSPVDYVHRVGRTARAGSEGSSALFLAPHEIDYLAVLQESGMNIRAQYELEELSKEWLEFSFKNKKNQISKQHAIEEEGSGILNQIRIIVEGSSTSLHLASKCFVSSVKSYSSYPGNLRKYFNVHSLHIGHLAESMGVTNTPKEISKISRNEKDFTIPKKRKFANIKLNYSKDQNNNKIPHRSSVVASSMKISEFSSVIDQGPKTKNK